MWRLCVFEDFIFMSLILDRVFVHLGTFIYCICYIIEVDCPVLSV